MKISDVPEDERLTVEERAAICEYEGGLSRANAEFVALCEWQQRNVQRALHAENERRKLTAR